MTFSLDISMFCEKAKVNSELVVKKIAIDMLAKVVDRSPVGNPELWADPSAGNGYVGGRFRGNWQVSFDIPATGETGAIDKNGGATKQAGSAVIQAFTSSVGSIYLMNNVPYAQRLEYGWSGQAPQGVVRITVAEFDAFVRKAVEELPD